MNKVEKYKKANPEYEMYLVDKKFGNGKQLIKFFYNRQINNYNQGFLAYVDNQKWIRDRHKVLEEVEEYLVTNEGIVEDDDFIENYEEDFGVKITMEEIYNNEELLKDYQEWLKDEFPKICLYAGGVCHFDAVS